MVLCSTKDPSLRASWSEAVLRGLAPDGGLYLPTSLPTFSPQQLAEFKELPFPQLASRIAQAIIGDEVLPEHLNAICSKAFTFDAPLREISRNLFILELFHGPTCAFKDFGARFMAGLFRHFLGQSTSPLTVLVATSGDTGSAVANAFYDETPNPLIKVSILFPKGKVTPIQEKQMTTLGHNVTAYEVEGTFDDCQALVKRALADTTVNEKVRLTSANSINIARLLPQVMYYVYAALRSPSSPPPIVSVPSGNLGNLTGGLIAQRMGVPFGRFIAACNKNAPFPSYLRSGVFAAHPSYETISNAMDVGNPSNFARILSLFGEDLTAIKRSVVGDIVSDDDTRAEMRRCFEETGYILCPHTAVGVVAMRRYSTINPSPAPRIVLATAHPAKFAATVAEEIGGEIAYPPQLKKAIEMESKKVSLPNSYDEFARHLSS